MGEQRYIKEGNQFGRPIAGFQAAQHHVANMRMAIDGARLAANQAIWWVGQGQVAERKVAIAKLKCGEAYKNATLTAHQSHGGMGYLRETNLHLWSERAKVTEFMGGAEDVQYAVLSKLCISSPERILFR
jgi:alkylation response protein AidB-like acyl-CoA dehydrogenase